MTILCAEPWRNDEHEIKKSSSERAITCTIGCVVLGISSDLAQPLAIIAELLHSIYKAASLLITLGSLIYLFFWP